MLNYDFDILQLVPSKQPAEPYASLLEDILSELEPSGDRDDRQVALFRDPATVEALTRASASLREFFLASGFGLNTYDSGAPLGRYPEADEDQRIAVIERLAENAQKYLLAAEDEDEGNDTDFRLADFLTALSAAAPWTADMSEGDGQAESVAADPLPDQRAKGETRLLRLPVMLGALANLRTKRVAANDTEQVTAPGLAQKLRFRHGKSLFLATCAVVASGGVLIPQAMAFL